MLMDGLVEFVKKKLEEESITRQETMSSAPSFSINDRLLSCSSDLSVDMNSYDRGNQEEGSVDSSRDSGGGWGLNRLLSKASNSEAAPVSVDQMHNMTEINGEMPHVSSDGELARDVEILGRSDSHEAGDGVSKSSNEAVAAQSLVDEIDPQEWEAPEPEDPQDDVEDSLAFNDVDDEDECGDGTTWGQPGCLTPSKEPSHESYGFKEEKQKAMEEVINGKFKDVVKQLLRTAGVADSSNETNSWVDIVTSLSWEAASFLKPNAVEGKAMEPDGYVKVKCIATGYPNQSEVIKGLVFKKHAAHKHMATEYTKPRLLLIRGVLGQSAGSGLSSFRTMDQEKDYLKSLVDTIEACHPNIVLVEKSVSRDVQESILAKGMTLVYDMKLHRLERVARCTGSPILSSDALTTEKLKQCDSFHIETFVEEHADVGEGEKKPRKTLMFIGGCPTRLGCTILLKGSHSDELKRIKYVVQIAVIWAYHLILETSFLVDWKAMFSTFIPFTGAVEDSEMNQQESLSAVGDSSPHPVEAISTDLRPSTIDIPIANGDFTDGLRSSDYGVTPTPKFPYVKYNPAILTSFSSISSSLRRVIGDNFSVPPADPYQSLFNYFGFNGKEDGGQTGEEVPISRPLDDTETKDGVEKEKPDDVEQIQTLSASDDGKENEKDAESMEGEGEVQSREGNDSLVLDSQSILVLMSRRNALRGSICEHSHFSHIMFYKNFDVPLGKFLRDNLLNQRSRCPTCEELPEMHYYYYAHHDKQLTIRVKRLLKALPGEAEGKIWMWSRCGKCKAVSRSTKRVLISTAARSLSFGKFLELSFTHQSSFGRSSSCGHSLDKDFLYFFGLGPLAALFKYSQVTTHTISLPPQKLDFSNSVRHEGLRREFEDVYSKGILLFSGLAEALKELQSRFGNRVLKLQGSLKRFSDIEEMLRQEMSEFEVNIHNAASDLGKASEMGSNLLSLNRLLWELLLESCIWELRLNCLLLLDPSVVSTDESSLNESSSKTSEAEGNLKDTDDEYSELQIKGSVDESSLENSVATSGMGNDDTNRIKLAVAGLSNQSSSEIPLFHHEQCLDDGSCQGNDLTSYGVKQVERDVPITSGHEVHDSSFVVDASNRGMSLQSLVSSLGESSGWCWKPFREIREIYMDDLHRGFIPKFRPVNGYIQDHVAAAYQLINEEGPRLHIPIGNGNDIVRDYDGELSSIIACALACLKDLPVTAEFSNDYYRMEGKLNDNLARWSSVGSSETDLIQSVVSISSEESVFSSFNGLNLLEFTVPTENLHPAVSLGAAKTLGKGRYSVVCVCAKQFRELRNHSCPSELDFIASLSRCKIWDAQGGKSKSFFAKTLDDRFIIKEIKKTEFESFVKFAPHYFKYMNESYELGNQTCLAKVLGIYQVIVRPPKGGKETRHDLMVMENLTFGRDLTRRYDLKGALHARYTAVVNSSGEVLLDQNFVDDMNSSPLYVSNRAKRLLERASINVMDYSLFVGIDLQRQELVCGIIDYLRQYTWDKQLETWVKSSLVVPKNVRPTVISPREYKKRFRKFISTHFLSVPDNWCKPKQPCVLCGPEEKSTTTMKNDHEDDRGRRNDESSS
ncbi:Putative 1-phosphatidylinositol-3-phosphate 5-kinase FAB1D [Linum perenne]